MDNALEAAFTPCRGRKPHRRWSKFDDEYFQPTRDGFYVRLHGKIYEYIGQHHFLESSHLLCFREVISGHLLDMTTARFGQSHDRWEGVNEMQALAYLSQG